VTRPKGAPPELRRSDEVLEEIRALLADQSVVGVQGFKVTARTEHSTRQVEWGDQRIRPSAYLSAIGKSGGEQSGFVRRFERAMADRNLLDAVGMARVEARRELATKAARKRWGKE